MAVRTSSSSPHEWWEEYNRECKSNGWLDPLNKPDELAKKCYFVLPELPTMPLKKHLHKIVAELPCLIETPNIPSFLARPIDVLTDIMSDLDTMVEEFGWHGAFMWDNDVLAINYDVIEDSALAYFCIMLKLRESWLVSDAHDVWDFVYEQMGVQVTLQQREQQIRVDEYLKYREPARQLDRLKDFKFPDEVNMDTPLPESLADLDDGNPATRQAIREMAMDRMLEEWPRDVLERESGSNDPHKQMKWIKSAMCVTDANYQSILVMNRGIKSTVQTRYKFKNIKKLYKQHQKKLIPMRLAITSETFAANLETGVHDQLLTKFFRASMEYNNAISVYQKYLQTAA